MDLGDLLLVGLALWLLIKWCKYYAVSEIAHNVPIKLVFPLKLEYTKDQWFAWDSEDEFLGQAPTKQELIETLSKEMDFPKDKFTIFSEMPLMKQ